MKRIAALLVLFTGTALAQGTPGTDRIRISAPAGSPAAEALKSVLSHPYVVVDGGGAPVALPRDTAYSTSVVILAPSATVASRVAGDVVLVGGDLFMHPFGAVTGRAIAIGGGVYRSALASTGDRTAFRDETFDVERSGSTFVLRHRVTWVDYETSALSWPFGIGLRFPAYTRVDGVILPWGPVVTLMNGNLIVDPTVTYRSDLGALDPAANFTTRLAGFEIELDARRGTFSNDRWIRGDLVNSAVALFAGRDTRNYYRADRGELTVAKRVAAGPVDVRAGVGVVNELGWTTGAELSPDSHPWSLFGRDAVDGISRPNPEIDRGRIESGVAMLELSWNPEDVEIRGTARYERSWNGPAGIDARFDQFTGDLRVGFPTFGEQRFDSHLHYVRSPGGSLPPRQRWVYLGGGGTLPTMDMLEQGGTDLFYAEGNYAIPVPLVELPLIGPPVVTLRFMTGAAGVGSLPRFTQNVGLRVGVRFIGVEYVIDPRTKEKKFGIGLSL